MREVITGSAGLPPAMSAKREAEPELTDLFELSCYLASRAGRPRSQTRRTIPCSLISGSLNLLLGLLLRGLRIMRTQAEIVQRATETIAVS